MTGLLRAEAGVTLADILERAIPLGWFLPVTPGTRYVTLGGAIANDVHGKNHHRAGSFGAHVTALSLIRSDGARMICTPAENAAWLAATIGGMGLTGLIGWAEIRLARVSAPDVAQEAVPLANLSDFFTRIDESDAGFEHVVAWIDSLASGVRSGRGVLLRGNHAGTRAPASAARTLSLPFTPPVPLVNRLSMRAFNAPIAGGRGRAAHAHRALAELLLSARRHRPLEPRLWPQGPAPAPERAAAPPGGNGCGKDAGSRAAGRPCELPHRAEELWRAPRRGPALLCAARR